MDRGETIATIRKALKERSGKTWSVTGGRGTAYGWITIESPPKRRVAHLNNPEYHCDHPVEGALPYTEIEPDEKHGAWYMSQADMDELATLLGLSHVHCQGVSIASSNDHYREYIARAEGKTPEKIAQPYWD